MSCPQCGAQVKGADPGERSRCEYCSTELLTPAFSLREKSSPEPPERAPQTSESQGFRGVVLLLFGAIFAATVAFFFMSRPAPPPTSLPEPPEQDKELEGMLAHGQCTSDCNRPCMEIKEPQAMLSCMNACDSKCKFVGKGTASDCRERCANTCKGAPDESARGLCMSGCARSCPP